MRGVGHGGHPQNGGRACDAGTCFGRFLFFEKFLERLLQ